MKDVSLAWTEASVAANSCGSKSYVKPRRLAISSAIAMSSPTTFWVPSDCISMLRYGANASSPTKVRCWPERSVGEALLAGVEALFVLVFSCVLPQPASANGASVAPAAIMPRNALRFIEP